MPDNCVSSHIYLFFFPKIGNLLDMSDNVSVCWAAAKMSLFHSCATTAPGRPTAVLFRSGSTWLLQFWPLVLLLTREWDGCLQIKALVANTACIIQKEVYFLVIIYKILLYISTAATNMSVIVKTQMQNPFPRSKAGFRALLLTVAIAHQAKLFQFLDFLVSTQAQREDHLWKETCSIVEDAL